MKQDEKNQMNESLRKIYNILLTGDGNTDFTLVGDKDDQNKEIKKVLKSNKLFFMKTALLNLGLVFLVLIVCLILAVTRNDNAGMIVLVINGICVFAFMPRVIKWIQLNKNIKNRYDSDVIQRTVQEILPGALCSPTGYINPERFYYMGVVPGYTYSKGSYMIRWNDNKQRSFCFSNLSLSYRMTGNGNNRIRTVFKGQAYVLNYKSNLQGCVRIIASSKDAFLGREHINGFRGQNKEQEQKIETENTVFNNNFEVYTTNEHSAFFVLSPYVMEQLLLMKRYYGTFGVAISGNEIAIALNTGYYLFEMPRDYKEIDKISVEDSKRKLQEMLRFAQGIEDSINGKIRS